MAVAVAGCSRPAGFPVFYPVAMLHQYCCCIIHLTPFTPIRTHPSLLSRLSVVLGDVTYHAPALSPCAIATSMFPRSPGRYRPPPPPQTAILRLHSPCRKTSAIRRQQDVSAVVGTAAVLDIRLYQLVKSNTITKVKGSSDKRAVRFFQQRR